MSTDNLGDENIDMAVGYSNGYKQGYEQGKKDAVKHGHWIDTGRTDYYLNKEYRCSCCDAVDYMRSNYCPNCGAKMEGDCFV